MEESLAWKSPAVPPGLGPVGQVWVGLFGLLGPLAVLVIELCTHMCRGAFFDPIPTPAHVFLILLIPGASLLHLVGYRGARMQALTGVATAVALVYCVFFLPLLPMAVIAVLLFGIGILPMMPLLSLLAMFRLAHAQGLGRWLARGFVLGLATLVVPSLQAGATCAFMADGTPESVRLLRSLGDRQVMLRACYSSDRNPLHLASYLFKSPDPEEARKIYYRVTGRPFQEEPGPREEVSLSPSGLSQASSRLDGSLDPDGGVAYLEWTFVLKNDHGWNREGVARVLLPPGAVVSRATLWVAGEEREAAFAGVGEARQAYDSVVSTSRDPLLVTTAGPDRVELRCFPIPPNGQMKFRIGISAPLTPVAGDRVALELPRLEHANFQVTDHVDMWLESSRELTLEGFAGGRILNGPVRAPAIVIARRDPSVQQAWAPRHGAGFVAARLKRRAAPERLAVVVDTSVSMAPSWNEVVRAVEMLRCQALLVPTDQGVCAVGSLEGMWPEGGRDNLPALQVACSQADTVIWIHAPQPLLLSDPTPLQQRLSRSSVRIYDAQLGVGQDSVLRELELPGLERLPRTGRLLDDLLRVSRPHLGFELSAAEKPPGGHESSGHLARIWAAGQVHCVPRSEALALALDYQLVTPLSGAVVLETKQQYQ
ncbi:MAG: VIT domain-containing protein, partial [Candidatus Eremiobacterota bacterium]